MIDARGYSCPVPLLMVQKAIKEKNDPALLEILVDAPCAVENITRFGKDNGYKVTSAEVEDAVKLTLAK